MEQRFLAIWTQGNVFCTDRERPHWHPAPSREFLPQEYNTHMASTRINRRTNFKAVVGYQLAHSDSARSGSVTSPRAMPRAWAAPVTPMDVRQPDEITLLTFNILNQAEPEEQDPDLPDDLQSATDLAAQPTFWVDSR